MSTFEIRDEEIDVEKIMERIRENIRKRKEEKSYSEIQDLLKEKGFEPTSIGLGRDELRHSLHAANMTWDVQIRQPILSYRRYVGRFLVKVRRLLQREIRWTVDPIINRQEYFNASVVRSLNALVEWMENQQRMQRQMSEDLSMLTTEQPKDRSTRLKINLLSFEEKFRGSSNEVKRKLSSYLDYFKECRDVLDIGCGRGEFLELLKENGIGGRGIDIDEKMVQCCTNKGLDVVLADALSYLKSLEDQTLDGVFSAQVIEHLASSEVIELVELCYKKTKPRGRFVAETINPLSMAIFTRSLYLDPAHIKPIHPETMRFLLESSGFEDVRFTFSSPSLENEKLKAVDIGLTRDESDAQLVKIVNENFEKLNLLLYGYQDYAVIARRP